MAYTLKISIAFAIGLVALGCGGGATQQPATAQTTPEAQQQGVATAQPTPAPPSGVTDTEVKAFANTVIALAMLEEQGTARVQGGEPVEQVESDLEQQMAQVFAANPITPERFGQIADQLDNDPALRDRIRNQLQESMASASA